MLSGEAVRLTHGLTVDGLAQVTVRVRETDAERARDVLSQSDNVRDCPACGEPAPAEATRCRHCGAALETGTP
jgi:ribosomal protein L40E